MMMPSTTSSVLPTNRDLYILVFAPIFSLSRLWGRCKRSLRYSLRVGEVTHPDKELRYRTRPSNRGRVFLHLLNTDDGKEERTHLHDRERH